MYRASITGNQLIVEFAPDTPPDLLLWMPRVAEDFGITLPKHWALNAKSRRQEYGKLLPVHRRVRHEFIMAMTDQYNIYSVGRFATWRQLLLDDVVHDIRVVQQLINNRSDYMRHLKGNQS
jgi:hypothetical protein